MRIENIGKENIVFRSGYPTFGTNGHLTHRNDIYDNVYLGFKPIPNGILKGTKINYLA